MLGIWPCMHQSPSWHRLLCHPCLSCQLCKMNKINRWNKNNNIECGQNHIADHCLESLHDCMAWTTIANLDRSSWYPNLTVYSTWICHALIVHEAYLFRNGQCDWKARCNENSLFALNKLWNCVVGVTACEASETRLKRNVASTPSSVNHCFRCRSDCWKLANYLLSWVSHILMVNVSIDLINEDL